MKLIKWKKDWADEHDVFGFIILTEEQWQNWLKSSKEVEFPYERSFGGNQCLTWEDANEFERECEVIDITNDEHIMLRRLFGETYSPNHIDYGWTPEFEV